VEVHPVENDKQTEASVERKTLYGEVLTVTEEGASVRLDDGVVAHLPAGDRPLPTVGARAEFTLEAPAEDGTIRLSEASGGGETPTAFDREIDELQSVLSYHRDVHPRASFDGTVASLDEERIEAWLADVTDALARLKKHRARRLSEPLVDGP
jgi:hypothetical protein